MKTITFFPIKFFYLLWDPVKWPALRGRYEGLRLLLMQSSTSGCGPVSFLTGPSLAWRGASGAGVGQGGGRGRGAGVGHLLGRADHAAVAVASYYASAVYVSACIRKKPGTGWHVLHSVTKPGVQALQKY